MWCSANGAHHQGIPIFVHFDLELTSWSQEFFEKLGRDVQPSARILRERLYDHRGTSTAIVRHPAQARTSGRRSKACPCSDV